MITEKTVLSINLMIKHTHTDRQLVYMESSNTHTLTKLLPIAYSVRRSNIGLLTEQDLTHAFPPPRHLFNTGLNHGTGLYSRHHDIYLSSLFITCLYIPFLFSLHLVLVFELFTFFICLRHVFQALLMSNELTRA
jgi:hypothetical protein